MMNKWLAPSCECKTKIINTTGRTLGNSCNNALYLAFFFTVGCNQADEFAAAAQKGIDYQ